MTDLDTATTRGQFIRNAATGGVALVAGGSVLASATGVAFARSTNKGSLSSSDIKVLQTGYIAETLAVEIYTAINTTLEKKFGLTGSSKFFKQALADEIAHQQAWKAALGKKNTPTGFKLTVPSKYTASEKALVSTGVALEQAFVATYLGAIDEFSSSDLKTTAGGVAANEASHYGYLDAAGGGNGCIASFGPKPITVAQAGSTLEKLGFLSS